ncbi:hypothetical protein [Leptospirillum ferriphilum]|uniref:hypothetical protein n=1 Tax=Leptospirillum ferriphilum TaxID=178606 RepID=UPI0012378713|nr:hypothetical protein [Leptospirillum ferriphilum]
MVPSSALGPPRSGLSSSCSGRNYFVYVPVDLGYAITASSAGNPATVGAPSSLTDVTGGSFYGDVGIGLNIRFLTIEAKVAYLPTPGSFGGNSFFFPISVGFDL